MRKTIIFMASILMLLILSSSVLFAHSGGLDKNGGHWNRKTGTYHYHK